MASNTVKIRLRRGSKSEWESNNPILLEGEVALEYTDLGISEGHMKIKVGDGVLPWNSLPYAIDPVEASSIHGGSSTTYNELTMRSDTTENWIHLDPVLMEGEPVFDKSVGKIKVGDGVHTFSQLRYMGDNWDTSVIYDFGDYTEATFMEDKDNVLKPRRGAKTTLATLNPVLKRGEICFEYPDTGIGTGLNKVKMGNGETAWNDLPYAIDYDEMDYIPQSEKGVAYGVAPLNGSRTIDAEYLPSYVDDVEEYPSFADFPVVGQKGKIYIDTSASENNSYRWGGTEYFHIAKSVQYTLQKDKGSVVLVGSDGSTSSVANVGGVEIRTSDPTGEELFSGQMWVLINN